MTSWDYIDWYNRQPVWLRVILVPILLSVMFIHSWVNVAFFLVIIVPYALVKGWIENWRFWRKLRERGQVGSWPEVQLQVASGATTLVVEITGKGPGCSWLIDLPREVVDPEHAVPTWQQFEEKGWEIFDSPPTAYEAMKRWAAERLGQYEMSALALAPSGKQLAMLEVEAKQGSVLAVPYWCGLSSRCI